MQKINRRMIFFGAATLLFLVACEETETDPKPDPQAVFSNGVLVVNEGNFGSPNGSVDFYFTDKDSLVRDVIANQNDDIPIGATIISAFRNDEYVYFISNSPDKIEAISADSLVYMMDPIAGEDISQPRFMTVSGDKAYVSCWGPWSDDYTLPDSYVAVIDLENHTVIKKINVHDGAEGIISYGSQIFVAGSYSDWVTVIDASTDEVIDSVQTTFAPNDFVLDSNEKLWTICKGSWDSDGALLRINPSNYEIELDLTITGKAPSGRITISQDTLYYITAEAYPGTATDVYQTSISASELPADPLITGNNYYGIAVDPEGSIIYIGDSKGFTSDGTVLIYQTDGSQIDALDVGVGPNGFLFF